MIIRFINIKTALILLALLIMTAPTFSKPLLTPTGGNSTLYTKSIDANVTIDGQFAITKMTLVFQNGSRWTTDAQFAFDVPPGGVATYFAYWAGDEKVVGRIVEKQQAAAIYEGLTTRRRDPALVEQTAKNTFSVKISPVLAFADLKIELTYVQMLPSGTTGYSYILPLTDVCQPGEELDSINVIVHARTAADVCSVTNNYGLPFSKAGQNYSTTLTGINYRPPKDLNLCFQRPLASLKISACYTRPTLAAGGYFAITLTPDHSLKNAAVAIGGIGAYDIVYPMGREVKVGEALLVCGRYKNQSAASVTLTGKCDKTAMKYTGTVSIGGSCNAGNAAVKLWAVGTIRNLSQSLKNRAKVIELCKQYTLPSKWASWLAVPKSELENMERIKKQTEAHNIAVRMAFMISEGKKGSSKWRALKSRYTHLNRELWDGGEEYLESDLFREYCLVNTSLIVAGDKRGKALNAYLRRYHDDELRYIYNRSVYQKMSDIGSAIYDNKQDKNYPRRIAAINRLIDMGADRRDSELFSRMGGWKAAQIVDMVLRGAPASQIRRMKSRFTAWNKGAGSQVQSCTDMLIDESRSKIDDLAQQLAEEKFKKQPNTQLIKSLNSQINRLADVFAVQTAESIESAERSEAQCAAYRLLSLILSNKDQTPDGQLAKKQLESWCAANGKSFMKFMKSGGEDDMAPWGLMEEYVKARYSPNASQETIADWDKGLANLHKLTGQNFDPLVADYLRENAYEWAWDFMGRYYLELNRDHPDKAMLDSLEKKAQPYLSKVNPNFGPNDNPRYLETRDQIIQIQTSINLAAANGDWAKVKQEKRRKEDMMLKFLRNQWHRFGDPLISVEAPANAVRVVALMPDGEVKVLEYNKSAGAWQGRFDIPLSTPDGKYTVKVIVITSDGKRSVTSITYGVDTVAPQAAGMVVSSTGQAVLQIDASPDTARVIALMPWGERVTLRKSGAAGKFLARTNVPAEYQGQAYATTFVLTDGAHNRTSITVDNSR